MDILIIVIIVILVIVLSLFVKGFSNTRYSVNDNQFSQAGISVHFSEGTINIKGKNYRVSQVTGITMQSFGQSGRGSSKAQNVIIELDDFSKPQHKIVFVTSSHGQKFIQRLSTAIRKAGGPNFT